MDLLFIEDNTATQALLGMLMESWGFTFDMASNGHEAVELAKSNEGKYDLCLMDTDMPIMDGFEAIKIIRRDVKYFPILSLSADFTYEKKLLEIGADEFLVKPCHPDKLLIKINELAVKAFNFVFKENAISFKKETPMNKEELIELRELKKKGLTKLKLVGTGHTFIVHRNIQNKISHDLIGKGKELSVFIDRSEKEPGLCHLYKTNLHVTKDLFMPEELEEATKKEDQIAIKFDEVTDKKLPE